MNRTNNRTGAAILGVLILAIVGTLLLSAGLRAEGSRNTSAVPDRMLYVRTAAVEIGAAAEMIDLTTATASLEAGFGPFHRTFSVCIENEATAAGSDLLIQFKHKPAFSASQLTTPADATVSSVIRLRANMQPLCVDVQGAGWIWQSVGPNKVNANAIVTW